MRELSFGPAIWLGARLVQCNHETSSKKVRRRTFMDIYVTSENAEYEIKTNTQSEIQTAVKPGLYTKEEVQILLESLLKVTKTEQSENVVENILKEVK